MAFVRAVRSLLLDPRIRDVDIDGAEALERHRQITMEKPLMRGVFQDFYNISVDLAKSHLRVSGKQVEIGGGGSFFKVSYPEIITTDVKPSSHLDMVLDAQDMQFANEEVAVVYGINCFHHLPEPRRFFKELGRVLIPGGGCVLIEPYYNWISKLTYSNVHSHEHFNQDQRTWEKETDVVRPMSGANQALSYVIFHRDRAQFEHEFPFLELVCARPMTNYLRYIMSGGVNFRQLLPSAAEKSLRIIESLSAPFAAWLAIHYILVLRKR